MSAVLCFWFKPNQKKCLITHAYHSPWKKVGITVAFRRDLPNEIIAVKTRGWVLIKESKKKRKKE